MNDIEKAEPKNDLEIFVSKSCLDKTLAQQILDRFRGSFELAAKWEATAKTIVVKDAGQKADMALARTGRLELKAERVAAEKTRKAMKEDSLNYGRTVDGVFSVIKGVIEPIEKYLDDQENFEKRQEEERFRLFKIDQDKKAEEARLAKEKADKEEKDRIAKENEDLRKRTAAAEEATRAAQKKIDDERRENQRKIDEANAAAKKKADDDARKIRDQQAAAAEAARVAAAKAEAERKKAADEKIAIEAKAEEDRRQAAKKLADEKARAERAEKSLSAGADVVPGAKYRELMEATRSLLEVLGFWKPGMDVLEQAVKATEAERLWKEFDGKKE